MTPGAGLNSCAEVWPNKLNGENECNLGLHQINKMYSNDEQGSSQIVNIMGCCARVCPYKVMLWKCIISLRIFFSTLRSDKLIWYCNEIYTLYTCTLYIHELFYKINLSVCHVHMMRCLEIKIYENQYDCACW